VKRFLITILSAITLPTAVNAQIDKETAEFCLKAADFAGCVKAMTGEVLEVKKNLIEGNKCPEGSAYIGEGKCTVVKCTYNSLWWGIQGPNDPLFVGKSTWECPFSLWGGPGRLKPGVEVPVTNSDLCPKGEPAIGWNSTCEAPYIKKIKKKTVKTDVYSGSVKINCDSPVWRDKPRCN